MSESKRVDPRPLITTLTTPSGKPLRLTHYEHRAIVAAGYEQDVEYAPRKRYRTKNPILRAYERNERRPHDDDGIDIVYLWRQYIENQLIGFDYTKEDAREAMEFLSAA